ncbi:MAG: hypothetical protein ABW201_03315 [Candidatus Thiodiazotropha sp.]
MSVLAFLMAGGCRLADRSGYERTWAIGYLFMGILGIMGASIGGYPLEFFAVDSKVLIVSLITAAAGAILVPASPDWTTSVVHQFGQAERVSQQ